MRDLFSPIMDDVFKGVFPFSPSQLFSNGEPGVWYDPSDLSTLFQDSAGTTPVTDAGQPVGLMLDKSGNGNHASQAITAARPILQQAVDGSWYLEFDGVDDGLVTPTITPGIDKVQVFAGLRKLSDATFSPAIEFSPNVGANNGGFNVGAPNGTSSPSLAFFSKGTFGANAQSNAYPAPVTGVITGLGDVIGDRAILRVNGIQAALATSNQGAGNYLAYPLYIGRRGGVSNPFKGYIYGIVLRFGRNLGAAQIKRAEQFVASKTGVTL